MKMIVLMSSFESVASFLSLPFSFSGEASELHKKLAAKHQQFLESELGLCQAREALSAEDLRHVGMAGVILGISEGIPEGIP